MLRWTFACEHAIYKDDIKLLQKEMKSKIELLVRLTSKDLEFGQSELIKTMMVLDVHCRDVVD